MILSLLFACSSSSPAPEDSVAAAVVDTRLTDVPAAPEGGMTLWGPEVEVPAYSDKMFCFYGTYTGEDVGINEFDVYQGEFGHHMVFFRTTVDAETAPDGLIEDCTDLAGPTMTTVDPVLFAPTFGAGENLFTMPEGMAASLDGGERWMIQAHYLNTSADDVLVKDAINFGLVPEDTVETWTAPFAFTRTALTVPTGESSASVECSVPEDYNVMFLLGHMHELGSHISIERDGAEGTEELYNVDPWDPSYRDAPPVNDYKDFPFAFAAGDTIRVNCNWDNQTGADVEFPNEMCAGSGMLYPAKVPVICDN